MFKNLKKQIVEETGGLPQPLTHFHGESVVGTSEAADDSQQKVVSYKSELQNVFNVSQEDAPASKSSSVYPQTLVSSVVTRDVTPAFKSRELEMLQNSYDNFRSKSSDMMSKKDQHISRLQERVHLLEGKHEASDSREKVHSILTERDTLRDKYEHLESAYKQEKRDWETKLQQLEVDRKTLESSIKDLKISHDEELGRLRVNCCCERLKVELKVGNEIIKAKDQEISNLMAELADQENLLHRLSLEKTMPNHLKSAISELNAVKKQQHTADELENENLQLKEELGKQQYFFEDMDIQSENHITTLANQVEDLHEALESHDRAAARLNAELAQRGQTIDALTQRLSTAEAQTARQQDRFENVVYELEQLKEQGKESSRERDELLLRNASLSHEVELVKRQSGTDLEDIKSQLASVSEELELCREKLKAKNNHTDQSDRLLEAKHRLSELEEGIKERDTTIRLQQQRLNDMKRTLQKELKLTSFSQESSLHPRPQQLARSQPTLTRAHDDNDLLGVNHQYLKHVLLSFVTSTDYEASQLVRAVATILQLSRAEEQLIWDTLRWKQSWVPGLPKPRLASSPRL